MSKLDIIITLLAVLYLPVMIGIAYASYRLGIRRGKALGHDEAGQLWPTHQDSTPRPHHYTPPALGPFAPNDDDSRAG